ncbi:MAG: peptidoglycan-binding protein [Pseudomonadota bacterium]
MPEARKLQKAQIQMISWDEDQQVSESGQPIFVQFNPESLKVSYSNRSAGGDQRGGSAVQFVGQGTTKLSFDLWLDVTAPQPDRSALGEENVNDVRRLTKKLVDFITPMESDEEDKYIPPGMRFLWGTFLFEGVVDSINETLDYFSEDGKPLRAKVSMSLSKQEINFRFGNQAAPGIGTGQPPAATPPSAIREGDSVQEAAAREGNQNTWQEIANANDIDNPRNLPAGTPLDQRP